MYVSPNFRTRKALVEAVRAGQDVTVFSPGPFPAREDGREYVEGPHYPERHRWYAAVEVAGGRVVKVY